MPRGNRKRTGPSADGPDAPSPLAAQVQALGSQLPWSSQQKEWCSHRSQMVQITDGSGLRYMVSATKRAALKVSCGPIRRLGEFEALLRVQCAQKSDPCHDVQS